MLFRLDPWGSGAVEIATRNAILADSVGVAQAHPLTRPLAMRKQPNARLGPVTAYPTRSGVGPRTHKCITANPEARIGACGQCRSRSRHFFSTRFPLEVPKRFIISTATNQNVLVGGCNFSLNGVGPFSA